MIVADGVDEVDEVEEVAAIIEAAREVWGETDFHTTAAFTLVGASGKRRRVDPHIREALIAQVEGAQDGAPMVASMPSHISQAAAREWATKHCCHLQAANHLTAEGGGVIFSSMCDGVRLEKPAQELLFQVVVDHKSGLGMLMPQAVHDIVL